MGVRRLVIAPSLAFPFLSFFSSCVGAFTMTGGSLYDARFGGIAQLHGVEAQAKLRDAHVCVIGLGGVGSWACEALARSGVGALTLIDLDDICVSNVNRQLHATDSTIGKLKVHEMQRRVMDINPECSVTAVADFVTGDNVKDVLTGKGFDAVLDAVDSVDDKCEIINLARAINLPVVTVGAAGGMSDAGLIRTSDITRSEFDRLLHHVKKRLRQRYGFPTGSKRNLKGRKWGVASVWSAEKPPTLTPSTANEGSSSFRKCDSLYGTACFVTGMFGFLAASLVVQVLTGAEPGWSSSALRYRREVLAEAAAE
ncbi:unnamed protein product [Chrysoparadoxa australica]